MVKNKLHNFITEADVQKYEMLKPLLDSLHVEMKELSKKKQDGVLNKLKVNIINKILSQIKEMLANEPTSQFIDILDEETLPTNSDVVLILSQFQSAMKHFHDKYQIWIKDELVWRWRTK